MTKQDHHLWTRIFGVIILAILIFYVDVAFAKKSVTDVPVTDSPAVSAGQKTVYPVRIFPYSPEDHDTIKRGKLVLLVEGFKGLFHDPLISVIASSSLFGTVNLENRFNNSADGFYGANITINRNIGAGDYDVHYKATHQTYDESRIILTLDPEIRIDVNVNKSYSYGNNITVSGKAYYFDRKPAINSTIYMRLLNWEKPILNHTMLTDKNGKFVINKMIPPSKFKEVTLIISARDKDGNAGDVRFTINLTFDKFSSFEHMTPAKLMTQIPENNSKTSAFDIISDFIKNLFSQP